MNYTVDLIAKCILCVMVALVLFPIGFVVASGMDASQFWVGALWFFFMQITGHSHYWIWPVVGGLMAGGVWQYVSLLRERQATRNERV